MEGLRPVRQGLQAIINGYRQFRKPYPLLKTVMAYLGRDNGDIDIAPSVDVSPYTGTEKIGLADEKTLIA